MYNGNSFSSTKTALGQSADLPLHLPVVPIWQSVFLVLLDLDKYLNDLIKAGLNN